LFDITQRPVLLYGVEMFNPGKINATQGNIVIDLTDKEGFLEALRGVTGNNIDVILHSPGGSPEATESLVGLLRRRFKSIRFIIPNVAKSAATMMAMSGDEIILGIDAELGPTDP
jgi:ClpP class serine protease